MPIESVMSFNRLILCCPLLLPPSSFHQGLFQWVSSLHQVAKVLALWPQHQSLQRIFRIYFLLDWLVWSPCSPRDSQESSLAPQFKSVNSLVLSLLYGPTLIFKHDYWKNQALTRWIFVSKVMSLFFNTLSRIVIAFFPRNKSLLISRLWSPSAVILKTKKIKSVTVSIVFPSICHEVMGPDAIFSFCECWVLSQLLHSPLSPSSRGSNSSSLSAIRMVSFAYLRLLIFFLAILIPACASSSPAFCMMYSA